MQRKEENHESPFAGYKAVEWCGEVTKTFGPYYTLRVYAFYDGDRVRKVDLRDLPWLVKEAGRENLRDGD